MAVRLVSVGDDFKLPSRLVVTEASLPTHVRETNLDANLNAKVAAVETNVNASVDTKISTATTNINAGVDTKVATAETNLDTSLTTKVATAKVDIKTELAPTLPTVVQVVTGTEVRPTASLVFWVGGDAQPANMGASDMWFAPPGALTDTKAPSIPAGLVATNISSSGFTLNWTASTDNEGVTGYDVFLGGVLKVSTSGGTTATIIGLTHSTEYSVTVKARDAAGNISAESTPLVVTTGALTGSPQHSIWGSAAYPYPVTKYTESTPITVTNGFYSYGTSPDVSAWRIIGMRIWIPAGITITQPAECKAWFGAGADFALPPSATATISDWVSGAWNEVLFGGPIETNSGDVVYIGYRFANGDYLAAPGSEIGSGYVVASDGSHIVFADDSPGTPRARIKFDNLATDNAAGGPGYSVDVIYDEGPI